MLTIRGGYLGYAKIHPITRQTRSSCIVHSYLCYEIVTHRVTEICLVAEWMYPPQGAYIIPPPSPSFPQVIKGQNQIKQTNSLE